MSKQFVVIALGEQKYCMPIELVSGVIDSFSVTNVPNSLPYVDGVANIRGDILPVVSLKKIFQLKEDKAVEPKLMSVSISGKNIGLVVDSASNVITVQDEYINVIPPILDKKNKEHFNMVADLDGTLSLVINPMGLFSEEDKQELFDMKEQ